VNELELTILMPCLNEAETLGTCVRKAQDSLKRLGIAGEVLVADNGSTDGSPQIAEELGARVVHVEEKGYGNALRGGIKAARGRYIIMGDADDSYDFTRLEPFVEKLREGYDLVMGNRFWGGIAPGAMPPHHRYFGNPMLSALSRLFFRSPCRDLMCGLRGFAASAVDRMKLRTTGMEFACEMVVKSVLNGLRVTEVPTTLSPDGRTRRPHLRSFRDGWRVLRFLLLFSPRWLFFYPGVLMVLVGLLGMIWLVPGERVVGSMHLDLQALTYFSFLVLLGVQGISFGLFTKVFGITEGFLPEDPKMNTFFRYATLERGLLLALLLVVLGIIGSGMAFAYWSRSHFHGLDYAMAGRMVVPSVAAILLGVQVAFTSFFVSVLGIGRR
jgi:glycosyltransferase involved in cell wall biosynthesis